MSRTGKILPPALLLPHVEVEVAPSSQHDHLGDSYRLFHIYHLCSHLPMQASSEGMGRDYRRGILHQSWRSLHRASSYQHCHRCDATSPSNPDGMASPDANDPEVRSILHLYHWLVVSLLARKSNVSELTIPRTCVTSVVCIV